MAGCEFPAGLLPDLSGILNLDELNIDVCKLIEQGGAFVNPLSSDISDGIASINTSSAIITTELADLGSDISQLTTWEGAPPGIWSSQDMTDIKTEMEAKETCANARKTSQTNLSVKLGTDFQGHTDVLSGVDLTSGITPNIFSRSGVEDAVNITRKQFNKPIVAETENMFSGLYDGGDILSAIKVETDKLPVGSVIAMDVQNRISSGTPGADKASIIADIQNLTCLDGTTIDTGITAVQALIDNDENTYTALATELLACINANAVVGWINNPFKLPLLNCVSSTALKTLAGLL